MFAARSSAQPLSLPRTNVQHLPIKVFVRYGKGETDVIGATRLNLPSGCKFEQIFADVADDVQGNPVLQAFETQIRAMKQFFYIDKEKTEMCCHNDRKFNVLKSDFQEGDLGSPVVLLFDVRRPSQLL
jgi:hypothetical protein